MPAKPIIDDRGTAGEGAGLSLILPLGLALLAAAAVMFTPQILNDGDTLWHRKAGEWMLQHRAVVRTDPFTFTHGGQPWTAHEWLSEVIMALAFRLGGWAGVMGLFGLSVGATIGLVAAYLQRRTTILATIIAVVLVAGCLAPNLLARPHVLVWPVMALWTMGLLAARERARAPSLWLLPLLCLWANLHGSFVLGVALIGPFALEALTEAGADRKAALLRWGGFGLAALAAGAATPHGVHGLLYPFQLMGVTAISFTDEWASSDFSQLGGLELALLATLYVGFTRGVRVPPMRVLLLLGLLHLALQHSRHVPVLALVGVLVLAAPLGAAGPVPAGPAPSRARLRIAAGIALAVAVLLIAVRISLPVSLQDGRTRPVTALAHIPAELRRQPGLNEFGFGGYLIESDLRPFIDGRTDMFSPQLVTAYDAAANRGDPAALNAILTDYGVAWTLLDPTSPAIPHLDRMPGWRRVWTDRYAVAHARASAASTPLPR